jgi:D-sedoheptulose 7-phosphate isomerase
MKHIVQKQLAQSIATLQAVLADETISDTLVTIAQLTARAMQSGRKLLVAGNGGSAADAQHLVAEFVVRLTDTRPALRAKPRRSSFTRPHYRSASSDPCRHEV